MSEGRKWTRDVVIARLRAWASEHGEPPRAADWLPALALRNGQPERAERYRAGDWPPYSAVVSRFGSWNAALTAAGLPTRSPGGR